MDPKRECGQRMTRARPVTRPTEIGPNTLLSNDFPAKINANKHINFSY